MTEVKICGLTRESDVEAACGLGTAYVGFNFSAASPRRVTPERARDLAASVPGRVRRVGVFVGEGYAEIEDAISAASLDLVQLHRTLRAEDLESVYRPIIAVGRAETHLLLGGGHGARIWAPSEELLLRCQALLFDAAVTEKPGGSGVRFDWTLLEGKSWPVPFFLAGGLTAENIAGAVMRLRPAAVDVASGVESAPGVKDPDRMRRFFDAVRRADAGGEAR